MTEFIIMTDSTTDLPQDFYKETGCYHQPHGFVIDGVERKDIFWTQMSRAEYFPILKSGAMITTTQPEMDLIYKNTEEAFKNGKDALYICFSSKLSGTYDTTRIVARELEEKYSGRRLYTVDTFCASRGEGWLVELAAKMQKDGKSFDEVIEKIEQEKDKIYHLFTVYDLMHLKRGGRLSATSAVMGTLIGIKPVLHMSDDGRLEPIGKIRGRHNALDEIVSLALDKIDESSDIVYVCHSESEDEAKYVQDKLAENGVKNIYCYCLGPNISCHVGCGTVGIIFHSEK